MQETDEALYRRFMKDRQPDALRLLFERYRDNLILFLMNYVRQEQTAEDLMMDTFAVIASGTGRFSERSSFKTWLFAIARNQAGTYLRGRRREQAAEITVSETPSPEVILLREEDRRMLYQALAALPEDYRQVLYLLYIEEMSRDEVCAVTRKTRKQVYNLTERGRKALREKMESMGYSLDFTGKIGNS